MPTTRSRWPALVIAAALVSLFVLQGLAFIRASAQTSDEAVHLAAGYSYLARHDFRLNPEHPPLVKELSALPVYLFYRIPFAPDPRLWSMAEEWNIGRDFLYRSPVSWERVLTLARLPNLLLGTLLVVLTGWWSYRLWGRAAALVALALAAFDPNLIAHSGLVTTDAAAALFTLGCVYLLWEYLQSPSWPRLLGVGAALGLALVSKFSCVQLVAVVIGLVGLHGLFVDPVSLPRSRPRGRVGFAARLGEPVAVLALVLLVAASILPLAYFFTGIAPWWRGLQTVLLHREVGHVGFFLGEYSMRGWWLYFPVAFVLKTPLGTLLLIALSLLLWRSGPASPRRDTLFLFFPVAVLLLTAVAGRINIGLRHILPVVPFLLVVAARAAALPPGRPWSRAVLRVVPVALTAASSLRVSPYDLAYFNEAIGGPGEGYRYLSDSNLDWGQALRQVRPFMEREGVEMIYLSSFGNAPPAALGIRYQYAPAFGQLERPPLAVLPPGIRRELLAVSVNSLQGVHFPDRDIYRWLYRRQPVAKLGHAIFVYDITGDAEAHLGLARAYLAMGPRFFAVPELRRVLAIDPGHTEAARMLRELGGS